MAADPVRTEITIDDTALHLFQVVHEGGDFPRDWVIVSLDTETVTLATLDFDEHRTVGHAEFVKGDFTPLVAGEVPVWGY